MKKLESKINDRTGMLSVINGSILAISTFKEYQYYNQVISSQAGILPELKGLTNFMRILNNLKERLGNEYSFEFENKGDSYIISYNKKEKMTWTK
ncbi:hypothetical protein COU58_03365 [Candidatus Pacearchaeota archaeon CG10_big_fil_rev_8_21_14_0_10_32_42]|nr:MAG: hypothetical protein COU58_03365 [Candidatus Pacearchaeota archaeon CG10_big_fil_rev_8_21_14_0_10_32_42]